MQKRHIIWARWGAFSAFFVAIDAFLGIGAVAALAELCLTDAAASEPMAAEMPMDHRRHVLPWLAVGLGLSSLAWIGDWVLEYRKAQQPWSPKRRPILAGLARVAAAADLEPRILAVAYSDQIKPGLSERDASIAMARFGEADPEETDTLLTELVNDRDRARFIQAALGLIHAADAQKDDALSELEALSEALDMNGSEIDIHWGHISKPAKAAYAVSDATAAVSTLARQATAKSTAILAKAGPPLRMVLIGTGAVIWRGIGFGLEHFIRAFSPQRPIDDDELSALRRRFKRRKSLGLSSLPVPFQKEAS